MRTISFSSNPSTRVISEVERTRKLLNQLNVIEADINKNHPCFNRLNEDDIKSLPLSDQYKIRNFNRLSARLAKLWSLEKYNVPVYEKV